MIQETEEPEKDRLDSDHIRRLQEQAVPTEEQAWIEKGARKDEEGIWRNYKRKVVMLNMLCQEAHSRDFTDMGIDGICWYVWIHSLDGSPQSQSGQQL